MKERLEIKAGLIIKLFHSSSDKIFKDAVSHSLELYLSLLTFLNARTNFN